MSGSSAIEAEEDEIPILEGKSSSFYAEFRSWYRYRKDKGEIHVNTDIERYQGECRS